jgi:uncharacterized membrane protein
MEQSRLDESKTKDPAEDNPALNTVIERNIRTIIRLRLKAARERTVHDRVADTITSLSGRMGFAYVHIGWFGLWILLNTGRVGVPAFDPFPYGLLTMIVSLEAIFLSTVMLDAIQRKMGIDDDESSELADLEMETKPEDVLAEIERLQQRAVSGKEPAT